MKPEDKDLKQGTELNEEDLDGVTGGVAGNFAANTLQYQRGMSMSATTMEFHPGVDGMRAQTLGSNAVNVGTASAANARPNADKRPQSI